MRDFCHSICQYFSRPRNAPSNNYDVHKGERGKGEEGWEKTGVSSQ